MRTINPSDIETLCTANRFLDREVLHPDPDLLCRAEMLIQQIQEKCMVGIVNGVQERMPVTNLSNVLSCCGLTIEGSCTDCDRLRHVPDFLSCVLSSE